MKISKMMKNINDDSVRFDETPTVSPEAIKEATMRKINANEKTIKYRKSKRTLQIVAVAAAVAVLGCGTVFAATGVLKFNVKNTDAHAAEIAVTKESEDGTAMVLTEVAEVETVLNYIPDGYTLDEKEYYSNEDGTNGFSVGKAMVIDTEDSLWQDHLVNGEETAINGRDSIILETRYGLTDDTTIREVFMIYPDTNRIGYVWAWGNMDKDEVLKIAEGLEFKPTGRMVSADSEMSWSEFIASKQAISDSADTPSSDIMTLTEADVSKLHKIGDTFAAYDEDMFDNGSQLSVKVTDVKVSDSLDLLSNEEQILEQWKDVSQNGKLGALTREFIKNGNGIDSLTEVVRTEQVPAKLVYVTLEYKNNGTEDMNHVWFYGQLHSLVKDGNSYVDPRYNGGDYDVIEYKDRLFGAGEMFYFDTANKGEKNYVSEIKAGDTATIHMAWVVGEDELPTLFLELNQLGKTEMVDIRQ